MTLQDISEYFLKNQLAEKTKKLNERIYKILWSNCSEVENMY